MNKVYVVSLSVVMSSMMQGMEHAQYWTIADMKHFFMQSRNCKTPSSASITQKARSLAEHALEINNTKEIPDELKEKIKTLKENLKKFDKSYEGIGDSIGLSLVPQHDLVEAFLFLTVDSENFDNTVKRLIGYAAMEQSIKTLEYFFDYYKLDPNMILDEDHGTALHWAAVIGSSESIKWLIKKGASVNVNGGFNEDTPLHVVCSCVFPEKNNLLEATQNLLVAKSTPINARDGRGRTPLDVINTVMNRKEEAELAKKIQELIIAQGGLEGKQFADDELNDRIYRLGRYTRKHEEK